MTSLKRNLKIFLLFSHYSLKTTLQARLGILLFTIGKLLRFGLLFFLIVLIFSKTKLVKGYSLNQMIIFYLTFNIIDTAAQTIFREVYRFRPLVTSGNFNLVLTKPYHPFLRILVGGIDFMDVIILIPYLLLTFFLALQSGNISLTGFILYLSLILNSLLIATAFHIAVLALAVITTEIDHTILIFRDLTGLGRFPIDIYREPIRGIFTFIIPVGIMMSFPTKALFNLLHPSFIVFSFLLSFVLFFLSLRFWNFAVKKYQSWGG